MGNIVCLNGFRNAGNGQCVAPCPEDKGLEFITEGNTFKCVYKQNKALGFVLNPITASLEDPKSPNTLTIDVIKDRNPNLYNAYKAEEQRTAVQVAKLEQAITKEQKTLDAFKELQTAENIRDTDPQGYQNARMRYYTLLKGETWRDEEKARLAKTEIQPMVDKYKDIVSSILDQISKQTITIDVAKGVKDNVLSIKDELKYATTTFQNQITDLKGAIVMEHRKQEQKKEKDTSWVDFLLNVLTVIVLVVIVIMLVRKFVMKTVYTSPSSSVVSI